ncbi:MAG: hypothetical protein A2Y62_04835 [Candidatus Fischerbacteria bacterium RBG_13_37_8]|uniref:Uncharacterized protein n=1 Tax=Candidatus Fischerbacteria bacterium RBG_13_37_8 TaxID=1817863 RepID=A0A1F5VHQ7_9BACT|nr:MAG: hypothetical protein A2Y62_04835 [Candidatus Fischerbacteria bacterium RBG_13_37_8]
MLWLFQGIKQITGLPFPESPVGKRGKPLAVMPQFLPLDLAIKKRYRTIEAILRQNKAKPNLEYDLRLLSRKEI